MMTLSVAAGFLAVVSFFAALCCFSLRGFSRGRLHELCRERKNEDRFGEILRDDEQALLAVDLVLAVSASALVCVLAVSWGLLAPLLSGAAAPAKLGTASFVLRWAVLLVLLPAGLVVLPWTLSHVWGERFLYRAWPGLRGLLFVMKPLLAALHRFDLILHRLAGIEEPSPQGEKDAITDEIRSVVDEGQREGLLESGARTMIHRVIELKNEDAAAVMTPRTEMQCIGSDATLEEARARLLEVGHSRMPVIGASPDDILGILYAKDLLKHLNNGQEVPLAKILREPLYVPETTAIDRLLETMKRKRMQMAIVLDEYGGVAGLVTMEDILEEIVGEIADEYDSEEQPLIHRVSAGVTEVDARVHLDDLNEQFAYDFPEDRDFDTISGFVFSELGRIPQVGEKFEWNKLRLTILEADKRKIQRIRIEMKEKAAVSG